MEQHKDIRVLHLCINFIERVSRYTNVVNVTLSYNCVGTVTHTCTLQFRIPELAELVFYRSLYDALFDYENRQRPFIERIENAYKN
jgi:hypothetical protein